MADPTPVNLVELEAAGDYQALIESVRQQLQADRRAFSEPLIQAWCGKRWRNLFLRAAESDAPALKAASELLDRRPARRRLAEWFLSGHNQAEWALDLPEPPAVRLQNTTLVFAPGLLNGLLPVRAFESAFTRLAERRRWPILRADLHPMRGCEANVADLKAALETGAGLAPNGRTISPTEAIPPGDVCLIGYSKGTPDLLTLLARHPELKSRVRCVFNWAGAAGGSFIADDIYDTVKDINFSGLSDAARTIISLLAPMLDLGEGTLRRADEYDAKTAVLDLTTPVRKAFFDAHAAELDALDIPFFSLSGATRAREVPAFQLQGYLKLAKIDSDNDMQLTQAQAAVPIPMSAHLAQLRGHHWDLSYDPFPIALRAISPSLAHNFPREAAITAMVQLAAELGLID